MTIKDVEQKYLDLVEVTRLENVAIRESNKQQLEAIEQEYRDENIARGKVYVDVTVPEWEKACQEIDIENAQKGKESFDRKKYVQKFNERGEEINSCGVKIYVTTKELLDALTKKLINEPGIGLKFSYILFLEEEFQGLADFKVTSEDDFKQIELFLNPNSTMVYVADTETKDFVQKVQYRYVSLLHKGVSYTLLDINILGKELERKKFIPLSHTQYKPLVHPPKPVYVRPDKRKAQLKDLVNDPILVAAEYVGIMKEDKLTIVNNSDKWNINKL